MERGGIERVPLSVYWRVYKPNLAKNGEGWDSLVQNPFLAFYQRWPWTAHQTPLLNIWNTPVGTAVD